MTLKKFRIILIINAIFNVTCFILTAILGLMSICPHNIFFLFLGWGGLIFLCYHGIVNTKKIIYPTIHRISNWPDKKVVISRVVK